METATNTTGAVLSRQEAAEYLRITVCTLDKMPIPRIKTYRKVFYRRESLEAWLRENEAVKGSGVRK
jgi:hypothetical protein